MERKVMSHWQFIRAHLQACIKESSIACP